ncbi:MAG TPA: hypothetical protein VFY42_04905 [Gemmatimonadales bacterium]|nr:hypothetical protein [Gemmatimonadales bacterium]
MRNRLLLAFATSGSLAVAACDQSNETPLRPSFVESCVVQITRPLANPLVVQDHTTDNNATWFIKNNGTGAVTLTGQILSKSGNVTAVHPNAWAGFPFNLAPGSQIDADLRFDTGNVGTGTVGMKVTSNCGTLTLKAYNVTIN